MTPSEALIDLCDDGRREWHRIIHIRAGMMAAIDRLRSSIAAANAGGWRLSQFTLDRRRSPAMTYLIVPFGITGRSTFTPRRSGGASEEMRGIFALADAMGEPQHCFVLPIDGPLADKNPALGRLAAIARRIEAFEDLGPDLSMVGLQSQSQMRISCEDRHAELQGDLRLVGEHVDLTPETVELAEIVARHEWGWRDRAVQEPRMAREHRHIVSSLAALDADTGAAVIARANVPLRDVGGLLSAVNAERSFAERRAAA